MALSSGLDNDQTSSRRPGVLYDQHVSERFPKGRPWSASIDKKSGYPVGLIQPKGWRAPWMPDTSTFKYSDEEPNRFTIPYEEILNSRLQSHVEYNTMKEQAAVARGWDPSLPEKQAVLESLIGKPPLAVEPIAAAMQGNKYMLGLTDKVDPRLEVFVRKETRTEKLLKGLPDFRDIEEAEPIGASGILEDQEPDFEDELDKLLDLEEEADPVAVGGKRVPVKTKTK